jgi:hypothetical protein
MGKIQIPHVGTEKQTPSDIQQEHRTIEISNVGYWYQGRLHGQAWPDSAAEEPPPAAFSGSLPPC